MDDKQEKLQLLRISIFFESTRIISLHWKILFMIATTLTLPLSFFFLFHAPICNLLPKSSHLSNEYLIISVFYFILLILLSLPSTSAVAYIVAFAYLEKKITYIKVMTVVPKIMERLMLTFILILPVLIVYSIVAFFFGWFVVVFLFVVLSFSLTTVLIMGVGVILFVMYLAGGVYIGAIWQMASMVAMFEECFEGVAIMKSMTLMKGKIKASMTPFFMVNIYLVGTQYLFDKYVAIDLSMGIVWKDVVLIVLSSVLFCVIFVFGIVAQTVTYLVCKSYHSEDIDKSVLSNRLEAYIGKYVALKADDIPVERV